MIQDPPGECFQFWAGLLEAILAYGLLDSALASGFGFGECFGILGCGYRVWVRPQDLPHVRADTLPKGLGDGQIPSSLSPHIRTPQSLGAPLLTGAKPRGINVETFRIDSL